MTENKSVLFSGIQPTGRLTLGNYIGAIQQWLALQSDYHCLFALVDQHAITVRQDPAAFRQQCYDMLALLLACGLDPEQSIVYIQSHVPAHSQLAWLLNCYTYYGELSRMTQFKDKSQRYTDNINVGLFDYPVLMAADILLYDTQVVPVGDDQKQHLELACTLAQRFNGIFGEIFTVPKPIIPTTGARLMSLQEPTKKMSKSDDNQNSFIGLLDEPERAKRKIKRAVTDSDNVIKAAQDKPGITNLLTIHSALTGEPFHELESAYTGLGYGALKKAIGELVTEFLAPIQARFKQWQASQHDLDDLLTQNAKKANERAEAALKRAYKAVGFIV